MHSITFKLDLFQSFKFYDIFSSSLHHYNHYNHALQSLQSFKFYDTYVITDFFGLLFINAQIKLIK